MSDQDRNQQPNEAGEDVTTNTADVREAIERAKEAGENHAPETVNTPGEATPEPSSAESFEATGLPQAQHGDTNTEALEAQQSLTISEPVDMPSASQPDVQSDPMVSAPAAPVVVSADHPMAALYMQQPDPPKVKSNRLAGLFISLLATVGFGVVYAAILAVWLAPKFPPSTFLQEGLYPYLVSMGFVIPSVAFFLVMLILVLIFNRSGWWVYAIFGVVVAAAVWMGAGIGYSISPQLSVDGEAEHNIRRYFEHALTIPAILAAVAGRESSVWFGAWIGARGRRVKAKNTIAQNEYEQKLAELKAPQTL